jgi:hypothetical protein
VRVNNVGVTRLLDQTQIIQESNRKAKAKPKKGSLKIGKKSNPKNPNVNVDKQLDKQSAKIKMQKLSGLTK